MYKYLIEISIGDIDGGRRSHFFDLNLKNQIDSSEDIFGPSFISNSGK